MSPKLAKYYLDKVLTDYELMAEEFSRTRYQPWPEMRDLVDKYLKPGDRVLDIGCGNGRILTLLQSKQVKYIGVDSSRNLLKQAQARYPEAKFYQASLPDLQLPIEQKFDSVFLIAVLHHIPSPEFQKSAIQRISDFLKPGGFLIMENWNLRQPGYLKYFLIKYLVDPRLGFSDLLIPWKRLGGKRSNWLWRFCHAFTLNELAALVKNSGFKLTDQYYVRRGQKVNPWKGFNLVTIAQKI